MPLQGHLQHRRHRGPQNHDPKTYRGRWCGAAASTLEGADFWFGMGTAVSRTEPDIKVRVAYIECH